MDKDIIMKRLPIFLVSFFFLFSCEDFLVENPSSQLTTDQFFNSSEDARSVVNEIYRTGATTDYYGGGAFQGSDAMMSGYMSSLFDNARKGERAGPSEAHNLSLNPVNLAQYFDDWWVNAYQAIAKANTAIKYIPQIEQMSDDESNQLVAEARFFRAYNYFFLAKNFGGVPLITEPYESLDNIFLPRSEVEDVYGQIITDLEWVISNGGLTMTPFHLNGFRITEGAATTLLSDVYLHMAGYPIQDESAFSSAAQYARMVINSGAFELISHGDLPEQSAYNIMRTSDREHEYIFSIEYDSELSPNGYPVYTYPQGNTPSNISYGNVWNGYEPVEEYVNIFESETDLRIQNKQLFFNEIELNNETLNLGEWAVYLWHDDQALFETGRGDRDVRVYRYAEVLLIAAEAIARSEGVNDEAISYLAEVRSRAYWNTNRQLVESELVGLSQQEFVEEVLKERYRELALDFKTWSDIQRTRLFPQTSASNPGIVEFVNVVGHINTFGNTFQEHHLLFPISDNELQRNPELVQNPGY